MKHIESLEEEFARSQANLSRRGRNGGGEGGGGGAEELTEMGPDGKPKKKKTKRGATHKTLTIKEEEQYMVYKMITDLFDFEELKTRKLFCIKRYKESLCRGELDEGLRHG